VIGLSLRDRFAFGACRFAARVRLGGAFDFGRFMAIKNGATELLLDADQSYAGTSLQTEGVGEIPEDLIHWQSARVRSGSPEPRLHYRARCARS
jgi:hypothetical protein